MKWGPSMMRAMCDMQRFSQAARRLVDKLRGVRCRATEDLINWQHLPEADGEVSMEETTHGTEEEDARAQRQR